MVILVVLGILLSVYAYAGRLGNRTRAGRSRGQAHASLPGRRAHASRPGSCARGTPHNSMRSPGSTPPGRGVLRRKTRASHPSFDAGLLAVEVAARIDSGADHRRAWLAALARFQPHRESAALGGAGGGAVGGAGDSRSGPGSEPRGDPAAQIDDVGVPVLLRELWERAPRNPRRARGLLGIPALIAVCRLTHHTGASAARILESCAAALSESSDALGERRIALAGPRSAVKMLAVMPLFGMLLGSFFGGNPVTFLFGTLIGRCCLALALICEVVGILWMRRLVRKAEQWG